MLTHAAGLMVLPFMPLPVWLMVLLTLIVIVSLWWCWPRYVSRKHRKAVREFTWKEGSDCVVVQSGGAISSGKLITRAFVTPWLVILYYQQGMWLRSLPVLPDMLPGETFRRLCVRLKMA